MGIMERKTRWAIIGGGNGGQSLAGHLSIMGYAVRLYDIFEKTVDIISEQGGIHVDGAVTGFGKLEFATTDLAKAIDGVDVVMIVAPATAHRTIAENCAPLLCDGQIVILHPGATCGSLEFKHVLRTKGLYGTSHHCRNQQPDLRLQEYQARDTRQFSA